MQITKIRTKKYPGGTEGVEVYSEIVLGSAHLLPNRTIILATNAILPMQNATYE